LLHASLISRLISNTTRSMLRRIARSPRGAHRAQAMLECEFRHDALW
jgi:hypothetical protein